MTVLFSGYVAAEEISSEMETISEDDLHTDGSHTLVACFSATGHTMPLAEYAADILGADLYEILPEDPYTEEDLAYYTGGRCDQEQDDPNVRPAISGMVEHMDEYDTVLIGHPIWHGQAPRIISTFLESYDFSGKTLVTFCTSEASGLGSSAENLHSLVPDSVIWLESRRFEIGAEKNEIAGWLSEIGLLSVNEPEGGRTIRVTVGDQTRTATLSESASAAAFFDLLVKGPVIVEMQDYGGFEKVGPLGTEIIRSDEDITTSPGDIILYQGDKVTIYYDVNTWNFTLLGHIDDATGEDMQEFLGEGDTEVTFSLPN
jgi:flavodoxin